MRARALWQRAREGWERILASPGGAQRVARGIAAGASAAMLPAFGLHLVFAAAFAFLLRASIPAAVAICLAIGNPLTHAVLLPLEYAIGRLILPPNAEFLPTSGPYWLLVGLPAAEETLVGGVVLALLVGALAWGGAYLGVRRRRKQGEEEPGE